MGLRVSIVLPALVAGVLIGAVAMQVIAPTASGTSVPSHGLTTATGCLSDDEPRGWIGLVPNADHRAVYLANVSYVHDAPDVEIRGDLVESESGAWRLAIAVTPVTSETEAPDTCQPRSVIGAAVALPTDAESLTIDINGEPIAVVDTDASAPRFRYVEP